MQQQALSTDLPWFWSGWQDDSLWEDSQVPVYIQSAEKLDEYSGRPVAMHIGRLLKIQEQSNLDNLPSRIYIETYPEEFHYWKGRNDINPSIYDRLYLLPTYNPVDLPMPLERSSKIAVISRFDNFGFTPMQFGGNDKFGRPNSNIKYAPVDIPRGLFEKNFDFIKADAFLSSKRWNDFLSRALACDVWVCGLYSIAAVQAVVQLAAQYSKKLVFLERNKMISFRRGASFFDWYIRQPDANSRLPHLFTLAKQAPVIEPYLKFSKEGAKIEKISNMELFDSHWHYIQAYPIPGIVAHKPADA